MKNIILNKLKVNELDDSLLEDEEIKKFVGYNVITGTFGNTDFSSNRKQFKLLDVKLEKDINYYARKKLVLEGPPQNRISFFTNHFKSKELCPESKKKSKSERRLSEFSSSQKNMQKIEQKNVKSKSVKIPPKSATKSDFPFVVFQERFSATTMKSKRTMEKILERKKKNFLNDPLKDSLIEDEFI